MSEARTETKLFLPFLQPFYDAVIPLSWLILRVAVGWNLLVHGWGKIMIGPTSGFLKAFADLGYTPPEFFFGARFSLRCSVEFASFSGCSRASLQLRQRSRCCASR
jgi:DoxX